MNDEHVRCCSDRKFCYDDDEEKEEEEWYQGVGFDRHGRHHDVV